jgi:hypothetical protein
MLRIRSIGLNNDALEGYTCVGAYHLQKWRMEWKTSNSTH